MNVIDKASQENQEGKTAFSMPNKKDSTVNSENEQVELESGKIETENVERERESKETIYKVIIGCVVAIICALIGFALASNSSTSTSSISSSKKIEGFSYKIDEYIPVNTDYDITIQLKPDGASGNIEWASSNETVATCEGNIIHTKTIGKTKISGSCEGYTAEKEIEVYKPATSVAIDRETAEIGVGETVQLTATVGSDDAKFKTLTWTSSNSSVASVNKDGLVTALGSGTSVITAKSSRDNVQSTCKISVVEKPIGFSGTGDRVINDVSIPTGCYRARISNTGSSNFAVKHYATANEKYGDLLVNEIGAYSGAVLLREGKTTATNGGMLEVSSSGNWTISIEKITDTQSGSYIEGSGDSVTGWISGDGKRHPGLFVHTGSSNFAVWIHDASGGRDLLVNEIGAYSGQAVMALKSGGKYFLEVTADGAWSISWD